MHMADALVIPAVAGTMYAASSVTAAFSVKKLKIDTDTKKIPVMGVMGAFVFAAQMINFTIPGTGSSGHLCGSVLLSAIMGPFAGFLTMIGVLLIQCLLFADGGILALGCNIWNMAFYGCFIGALLIWKPMMRKGFSRKRITVASIIGCILTLQMGAFSVTLETLASGITELPFGMFVAAMQPIHLAIGVIEGLITSAVLLFIYEVRPEILYCYKETKQKAGKFSLKATLIIIAVVACLIGGGLSLVASSNPDGLEWSIEKVAGDTVESSDKPVYETAEEVQEVTAVLPDYTFKDSDSHFGTSLSGVIGGIAVLVLCVGSCYIFKRFKKKKLK